MEKLIINEKLIKQAKKKIEQINQNLKRNHPKIMDMSLYSGKMGVCLFFFYYEIFTGNKGNAKKILNEINDEISKKENGLDYILWFSEFGWLLQHLKRIEVISDPGAKYDAEGIGGIINIVTEKTVQGFEGSINAGINTRGSINSGLYFSTKLGKFGLTTNLNYIDQNNPNSVWTGQRENLNSQAVKYIDQTSFSNSNLHYAIGNLEASYEFDTLNFVSITISGFSGGNHSEDSGNSVMQNYQRDTISAFNQITNNTQTWGNIEFSLNYQHSFIKPDQFLTFSYKLLDIPSTRVNLIDISPVLRAKAYQQKNLFNAKGYEHTFQIDYTDLFTKIHTIDIGTKYIIRLNQSTNNYLLQDSTSQLWNPIPNLPNKDLDETENISATYASYALHLKKFSIRAGVRYEFTQLNVQLTDTTFQTHYENLVPSVVVSYKINDASSLQLAFNQRISRPGIWYLNPFKDDSNPYSISQGNPNLKPEIGNSISLNYNLFTSVLSFNANLFANAVNNSIERISRLLNDSVQYNTYENIGVNQNIGLSVNTNWQAFKSIGLSANGNVNYKSIQDKNNISLQNKGFDCNFYAGGEFNLPKNIRLNTGGGYSSPQIMLQGIGSSFYYYYLSLSSSFLKKKLNISLSANNPFEKRVVRTDKVTSTEFFSNNISISPSQRYSINISYRFGELKNQIKKVQRTIMNDDVKQGENGQ